MSSSDDSPVTPPFRERWHNFKIAVADLWKRYRWHVRLTTALVVISCLWGAVVAGWPQINAGTPPLVRALASDSTRNLLTLIIVFFVAVDFQDRARKGVLDGDEFYNVARTLAYGYFKNFLVPALQLARARSAELCVLHPTSMAQLREYCSGIEPQIRDRFEHSWQPLAQQPTPGGPPRRTILFLQSPKPGTADEGTPCFFDAPTALFTVADFYQTLQRRVRKDGKARLPADKVREYEDRQIDSFFRHLESLFHRRHGFDAVADLVETPEHLADLRHSLRLIPLSELRDRYLTGNGTAR